MGKDKARDKVGKDMARQDRVSDVPFFSLLSVPVIIGGGLRCQGFLFFFLLFYLSSLFLCPVTDQVVGLETEVVLGGASGRIWDACAVFWTRSQTKQYATPSFHLPYLADTAPVSFLFNHILPPYTPISLLYFLSSLFGIPSVFLGHWPVDITSPL